MSELLFGKERKCIVVAEISANHGQDYARAVKLIRMARECGVDAVKTQAYKPETITLDVNNKYFKVKHPKWGGQTLYQLYKKAYTPWNWFKRLKKVADDIGLLFFATAFDKSAVDFLEELRVSVHKIASFELVDLGLIEYVSRTKKPIIMSTGMATLYEIKDAINAARRGGARGITLLKCVSSYPARAEEMNLKTIPDMAKRFNCEVGISDHSLGTGASIAAVALGAKMIEKHITLSRKLKTPDDFFSIEPQELKELVDNVRITEKAVGEAHYGFTRDEKKNRIFRRSLFCIRDIEKGEVLSEENIASVRPAYGIEPKYLKRVIGHKAKVKIKRGSPLRWKKIG